MRYSSVTWALIVFCIIGAGLAFWVVSAPKSTPVDAGLAAKAPSDETLMLGARLYALGGCGSCHKDEKGGIGGGGAFPTDFGTFYAPNISPSRTGIGDWEIHDLINAMRHGTSPDGRHYYPAFPYTSYINLEDHEIFALFHYLKTLPKSDRENTAHDIAFPFNVNRSIGLWKRLYLHTLSATRFDDPEIRRGEALVEGIGHCAECHTARGFLGGRKRGQWMAGGPNPNGKGQIPNITPHDDGLSAWDEAAFLEYFETGFTPEFDVVGGSMVAVQEALSLQSERDKKAIAAYLMALPPLPSP